MLTNDNELLKYALKYSNDDDMFKTIFETNIVENKRNFPKIPSYFDALSYTWIFRLHH